jgi:undecaprenyl diphosphate synthase
MMQSSSSKLHVAVIMDGNGRWAAERGLDRSAGHRAGIAAVRRAVEAARRSRRVQTLTLFAFSADNWDRPREEVGELMLLFEDYLISELSNCLCHGVRLSVIGRRDRLAETLVSAIEAAEQATACCAGLHLRLAVDYSSREAMRRGEVGPDVDLLIRTGGDCRLSDFLLWESAYAELLFLDKRWPDFEAADFEAALAEFDTRARRFGRVPAPEHQLTH